MEAGRNSSNYNPPVVGDHPGVARAAESHLLLHDLSECSADMQRLESASHDPIHEHRAQVVGTAVDEMVVYFLEIPAAWNAGGLEEVDDSSLGDMYWGAGHCCIAHPWSARLEGAWGHVDHLVEDC